MMAGRRAGKVVAVGLAAALGVALMAGVGRAQTPAERGREIAAKFGDAVVTVRVVAKMRMAMEGREERQEENTSEITATILDPSGLAVCALSEADPSHALSQMMSDQDSYKLEIEVTDVKLRLADGKELPAKIVLRDKDLDLAFIRPDPAPGKPLTAVDLSAAGKTDMLEETIVLQRLGEVANRTVGAVPDQTEGVIQKPRLMYVPGLNGQSCSLGSPVFTGDGKVIGILVNRFPASAGGGSGGEDRGPLTILLPADDVLEVAKQAPAAPAAAK